MARSQQMFSQPGQMYAPDTQRRLALAQALRSQGLQTPQGTSMGSGTMQRFAAPHWSQYVGNLAQGLSGAYMEHKAEQTNQDRMSEFVQALRGTDSPQYVMEPGYEQPSQMDRLSALEDNPFAQQAMMNLSMQSEAPQYRTLSADEAAQMGLPEGVWQMSPEGQIEPAYEQEGPDQTSAMQEYEFARSQGFPGSFMDYQTQRSQAGAPSTTVQNYMGGADEMQEAQGKQLGEYLGDEFINTQEAAKEAANQNQQLDRIEQLLDGVQTGRGMPTLTEIQGLANTFGVQLGDNLGQKEAAESLTNQIALRFRSPESGMGLPGATSDRDIAFLKSFPPGLQQSEEGRNLITESFRKINQRKMEVAQRARDLIRFNQDQGVNGLTWEDMDTLQGMWAEPMFDDSFIQRAQGVQGTSQPQPNPEIDSLLDKYAPQ